MASTEPITSSAITDILNKVDAVTNTMVFDGYAALAVALKTPLVMVFTVYVAFIGWSIIQGWSKLSIGEATKHVLKIAIVLALVTEWSVFARYLYNVFTNAPNELSAVMMRSIGGGSGDGVNSALQTLFNQSMRIGNEAWVRAGWDSLNMYVIGIIIYIFTLFLAGVALIVLATSKFSLSILLVLAPVFVPFLLWQSTKGIFEAWVKFSLGFALVPLFASAALMLGNQLMQLGVNQSEGMIGAGKFEFEGIATLLLGIIVSAVLLLRASSIAAGIAGGVSVSTVRETAKMTGLDKAAGGAKRVAFAASGLVGKGTMGVAAFGAGLIGKGASAVTKAIYRRTLGKK